MREASSAAPPLRPTGGPVSSVLWRRAGGVCAGRLVHRGRGRTVGEQGGFVIRGRDARGEGSQERGKGERRGKEGRRERVGAQK